MPKAQSSKRLKVPVSERALMQRINRKLAATTDRGNWSGERLRASKGREVDNLGEHYVLDLSRNMVLRVNVNPEKLGRELGVLREWEEVRS